MNNIIYLFGPSCSGKSTLGIALHENLGSQWTYIDRDDLVERDLCTDSTANTLLDQKVQLIRNRVIIDAQIPWREKREGERYFLILPPLQTLLERDANRALLLKRQEKRAYYAREYVKETYQTLSQIEKTKFDYCFDSSQISIQDEIVIVKTFIQGKKEGWLQMKYTYFAVACLAFTVVCLLLSKTSKM